MSLSQASSAANGVGFDRPLRVGAPQRRRPHLRDDALDALEELCETEGILTALETAHAYVAAREWAKENPGKRILIGNSGRGDKDMPTLTQYPVRKHADAAA